MSSLPAGWYKDPADTSTQRYWDGEGWLGKAIPADAVPPDGPPAVEVEPPMPAPAAAPPTPQAYAPPQPPPPAYGPPPGWTPQPGKAQPMHAYAYPMPQALPHGLPLAGLGRRLVARLIDIAAVIVLNLVVNAWFFYQYWQDFKPILRDYMAQVAAGNQPMTVEPTPRMQTLSIAIVMVATLLWLLYEAPAIGSRGQTLGKRIMGVKVVPIESTKPLGFGRAFARWARLGMWTLFWWCGVGLIIQFLASLSPVWDPRLRQAWHDKAAATVVVAVPHGAHPTVTTAPRGDTSGGPQ
ncbi:RDD family protein [Actinoplanes sp. NPDC051861]|uniref:RDD family protein n=1 Tax=Actinoplanes sp. NPDC051861 TaxID=3155170 RepID=UPI0034340126